MRPTLRWDKVDTIVRKELAEYRKNRYILISLTVMPLVMAIFLPIVYLVPIAAMSSPSADEPLPINFPVEGLIEDYQLSNVSIQNRIIYDAELSNCAVNHCILVNTTVTSSTVQDCNITGCTLTGSLVSGCNIQTSTTVNCLITGSVMLGAESESESYLKLFVNFLLMFFVIIPTAIPTVIASYSFVGEKLSRSLEPLLATPTSDMELLAAKTLAIFIPCMAVTWLSLIPTVLITDLVTEPVLGYYILPNDVWLMGVFVVAPLFCILSILINVIISAKVTDVRTSQQIGGIVVLPAIGFFIIALLGTGSLTVTHMVGFAILVLVLDLVAFMIAVKVFRREEILVRWR